MRMKRRAKVPSIFTEFEELRKIADVRQSGIAKRLISVRDVKGERQVGREDIADMFVEFCEILYRDAASVGGGREERAK